MTESPNNPPDADSAEPDAAANRRSLLRAALIGGGVVGMGGLAGFAGKRLFLTEREARPKPPLGPEFTYDVSRFQQTDPAMVKFTEEKRFATGMERPRALALGADGSICVGDGSGLRRFSAAGEMLEEMPLALPVYSVAARPGGGWFVGHAGGIRVLDAAGTEAGWWAQPEGKFVPTSIAVTGAAIYVADAGGRVVVKLDPKGKKIAVIGARDLDRNLRGFVVPSPYFCVRMAPDGLLRIANPGEHQIEAFTTDGDLEIAWGRGSFAVEGFCGCCNPVSFEVFPDGSFVTCEKGLPRVKLYDAHGGFSGLVAGPEAFPEYLKAANAGTPEVLNVGIYAAIDAQGRVIVLDSVGATVRIMRRKEAAP
ncbi:MAG: hypothetical protein J0M04_17255 [Verrucomicrobia bacterium]|nr:hypothetical protein [Verrucomicrobiota bacterium]